MIVSCVKVRTIATLFVMLAFLLVIDLQDRCTSLYTGFMEHVFSNFDTFCNFYLNLGILKVLAILAYCSFSLSYFPVSNCVFSFYIYEHIL